MDWVHPEAAPRFPSEVAPLRPVESPPDSASSVLMPAQQRALPELDASWATQGGSSKGLEWQAPSSNLAGWQAEAGSPREADGGSGNAPPARVASGLGGKVDVVNAQQLPSPPPAGSPPGSLSLPPAAAAAAEAAPTHPEAGVAPRLAGPPSYSSVAVFGPAGGGVGGLSVTGEQSAAPSSTATSATTAAAAAAPAFTATATTASAAGLVAVGGGMVGAGQQQQQQQLLGIAGSGYPAHLTDASPSPGANTATTTAAAAGGARPTPKKKPRGPRGPKKKPKPPMAPVRRAMKVKKPRPPEVPLGENGRERAMSLLRLLVGSPLSEEFRRPVVQLHPEVCIGCFVWAEALVGWVLRYYL